MSVGCAGNDGGNALSTITWDASVGCDLCHSSPVSSSVLNECSDNQLSVHGVNNHEY